MNKRSWVELAWPCVVALVIGIGLAFGYQSHRAAQEGRNADRAEVYAADSQRQIADVCGDRGGEGYAQCGTELIIAFEEAERSRQDLVAQTDMALWAFLMFLTSLVGVVATFLGVYYVRHTLIQAAETNAAALSAAQAANEANLIMRSEQRPWVVLERNLNCDFMLKENVADMYWAYDCVNLGKSPAHNITIDYKIIRHERFAELEELMNQLRIRALRKARSWRTAVLFPGERTRFVNPTWASQLFENDGEKFSIICCVVYTTSNIEGSVSYDLRAFGISRNHDGMFGPMADKLLEHGYLHQMG